MSPDQRAVWEAIEALRKEGDDYATARFYRLLFAALERYERVLARTGMQDRALDSITAMGAEFQAVLTDVYREVWPVAAAEEFVRLTSMAGVVLPGMNAKSTLENAVGLPRIERWVQSAQRFVDTYAPTFSPEVTDTTRDIIRRITLQALDEGLSMQDTAKRLREVWADVSTMRATRIARTEVARAASYANKDAADTFTAEAQIQVQKIWLATPDERTRETHVEAGKQGPKAMDDNFMVGGYPCALPMDVSLPASEVVNCRCTVMYVPAGYEDLVSGAEPFPEPPAPPTPPAPIIDPPDVYAADFGDAYKGKLSLNMSSIPDMVAFIQANMPYAVSEKFAKNAAKIIHAKSKIAAKALGLRGTINVNLYSNAQSNTMGYVSAGRMSKDGRYMIFLNDININIAKILKDGDLTDTVYHEMKHLQQAQNRQIVYDTKTKSVLWENKFFISMDEKARIQSSPLPADFAKYQSWPWEVEARRAGLGMFN